MLHWPDSMATYMTGDNILFSNDAFGQHYAVEELFNDKADQCLLYKEAMKYFANILNPFAAILTKKLDEIGKLNLSIEMIAPSHGAIWRDDPLQIVHKYAAWAAAYQENQVTIAYGGDDFAVILDAGPVHGDPSECFFSSGLDIRPAFRYHCSRNFQTVKNALF